MLHEYLFDPCFRLEANWPAIRILNLPQYDLWCQSVLSHCSLEGLPLQLLFLLQCRLHSCPKRLVLLVFIPLTTFLPFSLVELRYLNVTSGQCSHSPRLIRGELNLAHVEDLPQTLSTSQLRSAQPEPRIVIEVALGTPLALLDLRIAWHLGMTIIDRLANLRVFHHLILKQVDWRHFWEFE
jgi:hypothetical protein